MERSITDQTRQEKRQFARARFRIVQNTWMKRPKTGPFIQVSCISALRLRLRYANVLRAKVNAANG